MKVLGLFVLIIVCVMFGYSLSDPQNFAQKVNGFFYDPSSVLQKPVSTPKVVYPDPIVKKIGESFTLWNNEYTVLSTKNFTPVYDMQKIAGKYIGIKIKVTNNSKISAGVSDIYVEDKQGRRYEPIVIGYRQLGVEDYGESKIEPGFSKTLGIIFEISKESTGLRLQYPSAEGVLAATVDLGQ